MHSAHMSGASKPTKSTTPEQPNSAQPPDASRPRPSKKNNFVVDNGLDGPDLSFGIELEYVLASKIGRKDERDWPWMNPPKQAVEIVREAVSTVMKAHCRICKQSVPFKLPLTIVLDTNAYGRFDVQVRHALRHLLNVH
jgi:hypothetical protein